MVSSDAARPAGRVLGLLVLLTLALQGISWSSLEGYQLADSVEYMERARAFVRSEEVIDSRQIRSFGFSALLVPFFAISEVIGIEDFRAVVWLVRMLQMLLGVGLVLTCVRLGDRIAGPRAGLAAGFFVAVNPVFLQYSVSPLSDIAAAFCVGRALLILMDPLDRRRGALAGLWLGLGLLMAYKTAPITLSLVGLVLLRDRFKALPGLGCLGATYSLLIAAEVVLDKLVYRSWGASLVAYFGDNVFGLTVRILLKLGLDEPATNLYRYWQGVERTDQTGTDRLLELQVQEGTWYLTHLPEMLVWPVLLVAGLALVRAVRKPTWASSLLLAMAVANIVVLHLKSSKEFRLWLPLLPAIAPLLGAGLSELLQTGKDGVVARWRSGLVAILCLGALGLGVDTLTDRNMRKFSGYWRAIDRIAAEVEAEGRPEGERARVASAYHWAVFLRERPVLELQKLAHQLDGWTLMDQGQKEKVLGEIRDQDWFITHLPLLTSPGHTMLTGYLNAWFEVDALYWDREQYEELGPVVVFKRRPDQELDPGRKTLFDRATDMDVDELSKRLGFSDPVRLLRTAHGEEMTVLGATYEELPGDGHGWLTCYYHVQSEFLADYKFMHRITSYDERHVWQDNHPPLYGVYRTTEWKPGWVLRESRPVIAADRPYDWTSPYRPIGGAYRRGDLIPALLWMDVVTDYMQCVHCEEPLVLDRTNPHNCSGMDRLDAELDGRLVVTGRMERARIGAAEAERRGELAEALRTEDGWRWSKDDFTLIQRFFLPVHAEARLPDDGRPVSD